MIWNTKITKDYQKNEDTKLLRIKLKTKKSFDC